MWNDTRPLSDTGPLNDIAQPWSLPWHALQRRLAAEGANSRPEWMAPLNPPLRAATGSWMTRARAPAVRTQAPLRKITAA